MSTQVATQCQDDARCEPRTSLFVMAVLHCSGGSAPAKVRDISSHGALVESDGIPQAGTKVRLCRGSQSVVSVVMWAKEGRGGLRFEESVAVADWLPGGRARSPQQRVDEIVQEVKSSATATHGAALPPVPFEQRPVTIVQLTELRMALESLAADLADDPLVIQRHASKLQTLDLAAKLLGKLAGGAS